MTHRSRVCQFVIDCDDLDAAARFWSAALDATEEELSDQSRTVYRRLRLPDAEIRILLQLTGDTKTSKERMHLDIETDDVDAEVARLKEWARPRTTINKSAALTSGSCVIRGATSFAYCKPSSRSCSPVAVHGPRRRQCDQQTDVRRGSARRGATV